MCQRATPESISQVLVKSNDGDQQALGALMPPAYEDVQGLARNYMQRERPGHTLRTMRLVHEPYLGLAGQEANWNNRARFLGIAAKMLERILVDGANQPRAKGGGGAVKVTLDDPAVITKDADKELVALEEALSRLESVDQPGAQIVELRFFGGLSNEEASKGFGISKATAQGQ